jgi:bifunctional non-homologous end joining protein LigD
VRIAKRDGRLYLDVGRNAYGAHAVAPYSVRPSPQAPVSTPLFDEELLDEDLRPERFTISTVLERIASKGDPWAEMRRCAVSLGRARAALDDLMAET